MIIKLSYTLCYVKMIYVNKNNRKKVIFSILKIFLNVCFNFNESYFIFLEVVFRISLLENVSIQHYYKFIFIEVVRKKSQREFIFQISSFQYKILIFYFLNFPFIFCLYLSHHASQFHPNYFSSLYICPLPLQPPTNKI